MLNKKNTNIERIIAKIDNDFNPDNSDWIPRVASWTIDAMSMLNVLSFVKKEKQLRVKDRIIYLADYINLKNSSLYTTDGDEIVKLTCHTKYNKYTYTIIDDNKLELNFDTDAVIIKYEGVETYCSDEFNCELPVIPNNGLLIEAIVSWCMYKMLCRGYKHTVLNLSGNSPATNPYIAWMQIKDKVKASIINQSQGELPSEIWRNSFYIYTFADGKQDYNEVSAENGIERNPVIDYADRDIIATFDPNRAPSKIGQRWINTLTKHSWDAVGTCSINDWVLNN